MIVTSGELESAAEQLRNVAGRLEVWAERHEAATSDVTGVLDGLSGVWQSPDGDELDTMGRGLVSDMEPVSDALGDAAGSVEALASTASELAVELAGEERARDSADASARQAANRVTETEDEDLLRSWTRQHEEAVRSRDRAQVAIEEIGARWWGACEQCAAEVQGAADRANAAALTAQASSDRSGLSGASFPQVLASALAALWAQQVLEGGQLTVDGEHAIVTGTDESDFVELYEQDGQLFVRISNLDASGNLVEVANHPVPDHVRTLTVRTGDGNDIVSVPPGVAEHIELTFNVGEGNNTVGYVNPNASIMSVSGGDGMRVLAGDGNNTVHGTQGDDTMVLGGGNNDVSAVAGSNLISAMGGGSNRIQGGTGRDRIRTGDGNDYIDGGDGRDHIETTGGDNILVGGEGDGDRLIGGDGTNTYVGGRGSTHVSSSGGDDRYLYTDLDQHTFDFDNSEGGARLEMIRVEVEGRAGEDAIRLERPNDVSDAEWEAWVNRVESDLEMIRHTPSGQAGLQALDEDVGHGGPFWNRQPAITVQPIVAADRDPFDVEGFLSSGERFQRSLASPSDGVFYDTDPRLSQDGDSPMPSAIVLYHELAHAYDHRTGVFDGGRRDIEYDEVIVDADGNEVDRTFLGRASPYRTYTPEINSVGYDQDGDGRLSPDEVFGDHPTELTEFEIRRDLGLDPRTGYLTDPNDVPEGGRVIYVPRGEDVP